MVLFPVDRPGSSCLWRLAHRLGGSEGVCVPWLPATGMLPTFGGSNCEAGSCWRWAWKSPGDVPEWYHLSLVWSIGGQGPFGSSEVIHLFHSALSAWLVRIVVAQHDWVLGGSWREKGCSHFDGEVFVPCLCEICRQCFNECEPNIKFCVLVFIGIESNTRFGMCSCQLSVVCRLWQWSKEV